MLSRCCLIYYNHYYTEIHFVFNIFVSISRPTTKNHNPSKAHGWDKTSIRMIKVCGKKIAVPLKLIFGSMLEAGLFSDD